MKRGEGMFMNHVLVVRLSNNLLFLISIPQP